ncbi:fused DSP-PTPase phosphatase/NAD kinase-like protein [Halomonadaceae bacterium KBTZ08]
MSWNAVIRTVLLASVLMVGPLGMAGCAHFEGAGQPAPDKTGAVSDREAQRGLPFDIADNTPMAPYGDEMTTIVTNYNRPAPYIGSGGHLGEGAMSELKAMGFTTVVSLLTPAEGLAAERRAARQAGLNFFGISVSSATPTAGQVQSFAEIASTTSHYPILIHCASSNRVGAMWALYRHRMGVPAGIALEEGKAAGLKPSKEVAVRERLGLDPGD